MRIVPVLAAFIVLTGAACSTNQFKGSSPTRGGEAQQDGGKTSVDSKDAGASTSSTDAQAAGQKASTDLAANAKQATDEALAAGNKALQSVDLRQLGGAKVFTKDEMITSLVVLEECKAQIFLRTHDLSLCVKCFDQWLASGKSISASSCGCVQTTAPNSSPAPTP